MSLKRNYGESNAVTAKNPATAQRHTGSERPQYDTDTFRKPWDMPDTVETRKKMSCYLAENLLDDDIKPRAALYSRLPDDMLESFFSASEKIMDVQRSLLRLGVTSVLTGGGVGIHGLMSGFNMASLAAGAVGILGTVVAGVKMYVNDKKRNVLIGQVDHQLAVQEIRLPKRPRLGYHRDERDFNL